MPVVDEILGLWAAPRRSVRARLDQGVREDRALARLMAACALIFLAQWPGLLRAARIDPAIPLEARLGGALLACLVLLPLLAYALAGLSHLLARLFGGRGTGHGARVALFGAMLAIAPAMLAHGLVLGLAGPGGLHSALGVVVLGAFAVLWGAALIEAERG